MKSPTISIANKGFLTIEIIISFSLFILFTVSAFAMESSMTQLHKWSSDRLARLNTQVYAMDHISSTTPYGNDSEIKTAGPLSKIVSDYVQAWGQDTCSPRITFDKNKVALYSQGTSLGSGNVSTDIKVRSAVAYITSNSSTQSLADFFIVDATIPTSTKIISSINTGPGLSAVSIAGPYAFVANMSTVSQMQVIDMTDRKSPQVIAEIKLPLPQASTTPTIARSIFYRGGYVYLGTEKWDGPELYVIDVSSPYNPTIVGSFEIGTLVNSIYVVNDIAYLATSDQYQMRVLDVSNKNAPQLVYTFSPNGWQTQEGKVVDYFENTLALGRTNGGINVTANHEIFRFSSTSPQTIAYSKDVPSGVYGILQRSPNIFLLTHTTNSQLEVWNDTLQKKFYSLSLGLSPVAMVCDGSTLYFATGTNKGLSIVKIQ